MVRTYSLFVDFAEFVYRLGVYLLISLRLFPLRQRWSAHCYPSLHDFQLPGGWYPSGDVDVRLTYKNMRLKNDLGSFSFLL